MTSYTYPTYQSFLLVAAIVMTTCWGCSPEWSYNPSTPGSKAQDLGAQSEREQLVQDQRESDSTAAANASLSTLIFAPFDERDVDGSIVAISLRKTEVTLSDLAKLDEAASIRRLDAGSSKLTDADMEFLSALTGLAKLELGINTDITDAGLKHLKGLKNLRILSLAFCPQLTGAGFAELRELDNLMMLNISNNKNITDDSLKYLQEMEKLQVVQAQTMLGITDIGLKHLSQIRDLRRLRFESPLVTDAGLYYLAELKNSDTLDLRGSTGFTEPGIEQLRQALPNCQIIW